LFYRENPITNPALLGGCRAALKNSHETIGFWGAYASDYFEHKRKLSEDIKKYQPMIAEIEAALAQPPVGYAILDADGKVIGVERHAIDAGYWLRRGIPGRTVKPLYL